MGTPTPDTDGSSTEVYQHRAQAKKAAEQLRVREQYERGSLEASRQKAGAAQSRQATSQDAADAEEAFPGIQQEESGQAGTVPTVARLEISLRVTDAVAAVDAVERAVTRCGGTIVKRAYNEYHHRLVARVESAKLSSLSRQLAKIGTVQKPPKPTGEEETTVEIGISW